jgi:sugar O-acyltransferase (sialic acid O-acetyltransferase NeuD family)
MTDTTELRELVLIGGGEHAHVVLDAARTQPQWSVVGFVDPRPRTDLQARGLAWLGDDPIGGDSLRGRYCIVTVGGIGESDRRQSIVRRYESLGVTWATVVHARAVVSTAAVVGPGAAILAAAVINPAARVGEHCIVNTGAIVEHDVDLQPFAHVGPGAAIGGGTAIGAGAYVGLGASVRDHISIGAGAVIGMGAVVIEAVPDGVVVVGVPGRPIRSVAAPTSAVNTRADSNA